MSGLFKIYEKPYGGYRGCPTWTKVKTVLRMIHDNKCALCGGTHILTVHHINLWKNDLTLGNLILLCTNCHLDPELSLHFHAYSKISVVEISLFGNRIGGGFYHMPPRDYFRMCRNWEYEGLLPPSFPWPFSKEDTEQRIRELSSVFFLYALLYDFDLELYDERFSFDGVSTLKDPTIVVDN